MSDRMKLYIQTIATSMLVVLMAAAGTLLLTEMISSGDYNGPLGLLILVIVGGIFYGGAIHTAHAVYRAYKDEIWVVRHKENRAKHGWEW